MDLSFQHNPQILSRVEVKALEKLFQKFNASLLYQLCPSFNCLAAVLEVQLNILEVITFFIIPFIL